MSGLPMSSKRGAHFVRNTSLLKQMLDMVFEGSARTSFTAIQNAQCCVDEVVDIPKEFSCDRILTHDAFDELK